VPDNAYAFSNRKSTGSKSLGCWDATAPSPRTIPLRRPMVSGVEEDGRTNAYDDEVKEMTMTMESVTRECLIIMADGLRPASPVPPPTGVVPRSRRRAKMEGETSDFWLPGTYVIT
jgi:hypothetical protein